MDAIGRTGDRDRDDDGRAENQRPRDRYGRPLPHGSSEGVERIPSDAVFAPYEGLDEAQRLLDNGYAFHAHEVLEAVWKNASEKDRELWRGLAQLAVGLTHAQRGNRVGAARLLRRGADRVADYGRAAPNNVDAPGAARYGRAVADQLEDDGDSHIDTSGLRLRASGH